jgi:hypothetical protein
MQNPKCQVYPNLPFENLIPAIDAIHYDGRTLRVTLLFKPQDYELVYLDFEYVMGFRMLREGDLLDFANDEYPRNWLLCVSENGWYEQEKLRKGFTSQYVFDMKGNRPNEFFILGESDCISVLTSLTDFPKITFIER